MVKVFQDTDKEFYMDGYHKDNLDMAKKVVTKDWDMIFVYDGYEGSGKSVKAMQDAFYCDPTLDLKRIVFNPKDFQNAVKVAEKYQAIVYDEAYGGLSSRSAMGAVNRALVKMLTVIRAKNLFIFVVLPCFFDLDRYVAVWRSRALVHIYTNEGFQRGFFEFYNTDRKLSLYMLGKKFYEYKKGRPNFRGRFYNTYVVNEKHYRKKKNNTSIQIEDETRYERVASKMKDKLTLITKNIKKKYPELSERQIAQLLDVTQPSIGRYLSFKKQ